MTDIPAEFAFIERHFRALAGPGSLDLHDDAALVSPPPGAELVIAADAMVEGVHFLPDDPPGDLGRKLLRVNLSDLAAMGADPLGYLITLCVPRHRGDDYFAAFSRGLALDQAQFGISLLGGDTTATAGPMSMSLTVVGSVPRGQAVRRSGARAGDELWVTGSIGDGALGLLALRGEIEDPDGFLADRYHLPRPRLGLPIRGLANAAIDVSDGLLQDAMHLCRASNVALTLEAASIPLSPQARSAGDTYAQTCWSGGDDYELLLALSAGSAATLLDAARVLDCPLTRIGRFQAGLPCLSILDADKKVISVARHGFSHF